MSTRRVLLTIVCALLLGPHGSAAASPQLEAGVNPQELKAGEKAAFSVAVQWPAEEANYSFVFPSVPLQNLMLTRQGESQETLSENGKLLSKKTFLLELEPAGTGTGTIGPFSIQYLDPATQASGSLDVQAYNVSLLSPPKNKTWIFAAAGLLAAALIGILSTFLKKRRKAVPETAAVVSPADQAIARIREIAAVGGTWKQEDKLSGISSEFRSFLMSHYGIQKARAADPEILSELELRKLDSLEIKTVRDLCGRIHEAKYSGAPLSDRDLKDFSEDIVHFISGKRIVGNP